MRTITCGIGRFILAVLLLPAQNVEAFNNSESITPHMGWNTWNAHKCDINEDVIRTAAAKLKQTGLAAKGYNIVWIDDCWQSQIRDAKTGRVLPDPVKFPSGFKKLTDGLHDAGLRAGIYSSAGTKTCGGFPGSLGKEDVDALFYAESGFDALKYDNCFHEGQSGSAEISAARFAKMSDAIAATKRKMVLALCNWGQDDPWKWAGQKWNSWRISGDIATDFGDDSGNCIAQPPPTADYGGYDCSVRKIVDKVAAISSLGRSQGWNDMDMLEIGNHNLTQFEEITHFSMWALAKSPLILGNDMSSLDNRTLAIVGNTDIIAISQDALHEPATRIAKLSNHDNVIDIWSGRLAGNAHVLSVTNYADKDATLDVAFADVMPSADANTAFDVFDLWSGVNFDAPDRSLPSKRMPGSPFKKLLPRVQAPAHGTRVFRFEPHIDT